MSNELMKAIIEEGKKQGIEITDGTNIGHYQKVKFAGQQLFTRTGAPRPACRSVSPVGGWIHTRCHMNDPISESAQGIVKWCLQCSWRCSKDALVPSKTATVSFGQKDEYNVVGVAISEHSG